MKGDYDIFLASDDGYAAHLATAIASIGENNRDIPICVHILDGGLQEQSLSRINVLKDRYPNLSIARHDATVSTLREKLGGKVQSFYQTRSLTAYARLMLGDILDEDIRYALYLDVDGIVLGDIKPLFERGMDGYPIAAVKDIRTASVRLRLGLKEETPYLCTGMMLFDMDVCRQEGIFERFKQLIIERNGQVLDMDQGVVNCVLNGNFKILHPRYNCMTPFFSMTAEQLREQGRWDSYYSQSELREAVEKPVFVHFTQGDTTRPWQEHCRHPLRDEYLKYRAMTPFPLDKLGPDKRKFHVKLFAFLYHHLPYRAYKVAVRLIYMICGKEV